MPRIKREKPQNKPKAKTVKPTTPENSPARAKLYSFTFTPATRDALEKQANERGVTYSQHLADLVAMYESNDKNIAGKLQEITTSLMPPAHYTDTARKIMYVVANQNFVQFTDDEIADVFGVTRVWVNRVKNGRAKS